MGGRAGGTGTGFGSRSGGGLGKDRSGYPIVFKGGWSGSDKDTADIGIYAINKQTEKAINVKTGVDWAKGKMHIKDLWIPKSTISTITKTGSNSMTLHMKKSMAQSIGKQNNFKGYDMDFTNGYNVWG